MQAQSITQISFFKDLPYNSGMPHPGGRPTSRKRNDLGERIAQARERMGLSQYDLARELNVTQPTVAGWERKVSNIRSDTLAKLAIILKTSADELLGLQTPKEKSIGGKTLKLFQEVSTLPRRQKEKVLESLEDSLEGQKRRMQRKAS